MPAKFASMPEHAVELDGMADGFVNLQAELRAIENDRALAFGALRGRMQRDGFFADARRVADQIERFDQFVAAQHVLPAEAIRIRTLLNFASGERRGDDSRAGLHLHLMNRRADARNEKLLDAAKRHRAFGERHALHFAHFLVRREQQIDLALDGNAERIFDEGILPGVDVGVFGRERDVFALGQRGGFRDGHGFGGAGLRRLRA